MLRTNHPDSKAPRNDDATPAPDASSQVAGKSENSSQVQPALRADEDSDDQPEQLQIKVILLGNGAVGKTSIAMRFSEDHFAKQYKQTIGVDFFIKRLVLPGDVSSGSAHSQSFARVQTHVDSQSLNNLGHSP